MAIVSADFIQNYPNTTKSVRDLAVLKSARPTVSRAFLRATTMEDWEADAALSLASKPPSIVGAYNLRLVPHVISANDIAGYSRYPGNLSEDIKVNVLFLEQFEAVFQAGSPQEKHNAKILMESKLLHELVHWGRALKNQPAGPVKGPLEEGWLFEKDAYGRAQVSSVLGLSQYIADF